MSELRRILLLWRRRWGRLLLGLLATLLSLGLALALMWLAGGRLAAGLTGGVAVAALLGLRWTGTLRVVMRYLERLSTHDATFRALADLRVWFFRGLAGRAAGGLGFRRAGDMLARLVNDVEALDGLYMRILLPLAGALLAVPVLLALVPRGGEVARSHGLIWAVAGLCAVAALLVPWLAARGALAGGQRLVSDGAALRVAVLDAVTGLREVRAYGAEQRVAAVVAARESALFEAQEAVARRGSLAGVGAFLCGQAVMILLLAGAVSAAPAAGVAALFLAVAVFEALGGLPRAGILAGTAVAAARRVLAAAEGPLEYPEPAAAVVAPADSTLSFEAVKFRWQPGRPSVLDGLTMEIPAGARVAILGPSGSGKSTLAALALRVGAPQSGRVLLGGVDLASLPSELVRRRIAWLSQATHLFDDSIRNNLLLGHPGASEEQLWEALDAAAIGDVVRALPERLDAWVGEGGARFSGGQGRRLALARTLLSPAPILLLDEPAAGLDARTEQAFLETLNQVAAGRTVILIAHRLTGVAKLDRIWRISGGRAVAAAG